MSSKLIQMDNNEMLLFIGILQNEYDENGTLKETDLNKVLEGFF